MLFLRICRRDFVREYAKSKKRKSLKMKILIPFRRIVVVVVAKLCKTINIKWWLYCFCLLICDATAGGVVTNSFCSGVWCAAGWLKPNCSASGLSLQKAAQNALKRASHIPPPPPPSSPVLLNCVGGAAVWYPLDDACVSKSKLENFVDLSRWFINFS